MGRRAPDRARLPFAAAGVKPRAFRVVEARNEVLYAAVRLKQPSVYGKM